jgi:hypothetical protein
MKLMSALTFASLRDEVAASLRNDEEAEVLRLVADFYTTAIQSETLIGDFDKDPGSVSDPRWDALIAGLAERIGHKRGWLTPSWTIASGRFLSTWWFVTEYVSLHALALVESPAESANRGVFLDEASLVSV